VREVRLDFVVMVFLLLVVERCDGRSRKHWCACGCGRRDCKSVSLVRCLLLGFGRCATRRHVLREYRSGQIGCTYGVLATSLRGCRPRCAEGYCAAPPPSRAPVAGACRCKGGPLWSGAEALEAPVVVPLAAVPALRVAHGLAALALELVFGFDSLELGLCRSERLYLGDVVGQGADGETVQGGGGELVCWCVEHDLPFSGGGGSVSVERGPFASGGARIHVIAVRIDDGGAQ